MSGSTSNVQMLPSISMTSCGSYSYYGNYPCTTTMQVSLTVGVSIPHYAIQVIVWVLLYDDTKWASTNNINVGFGSSTTTRSMGSFDGQ